MKRLHLRGDSSGGGRIRPEVEIAKCGVKGGAGLK